MPDGAPFPSGEDAALFYVASTVPGSPLSHAWLARGTETISSLDAVGRGRFTLLTGIGGATWTVAAQELASHLGIPLDVVSIGPGLAIEDPYGEWAHVREIAEDGCLLVRPDRHIAFRARHAVDDPATVLSDAFRRLLGRAPHRA
ncbi:hypothetical protein AB3X52_06305 [Nocardioides sp. DS6]|uniref:2,4-dichlorophenol 6-monooxygenase n=1 Tax=Nocardioides eburneus TaxID=3231482 RepID=A0ABV3SWK2_9ACTN